VDTACPPPTAPCAACTQWDLGLEKRKGGGVELYRVCE
jgi:hypothetical protein